MSRYRLTPPPTDRERRKRAFPGRLGRAQDRQGHERRECQPCRERHGGSIGTRMTPGRVKLGMKMPGHMGDQTTSVLNQVVAKVIGDQNLILIRGGIPVFDGVCNTLADDDTLRRETEEGRAFGFDGKAVQTEQYHDHAGNRLNPGEESGETGNGSGLAGPMSNDSGELSSLKSQSGR